MGDVFGPQANLSELQVSWWLIWPPELGNMCTESFDDDAQFQVVVGCRVVCIQGQASRNKARQRHRSLVARKGCVVMFMVSVQTAKPSTTVARTPIAYRA